MKLTKPIYLFVVRVAMISTVLVLITNAIFVLTDDIKYIVFCIVCSVVALIFATIMIFSNHKYKWSEVFGIKNGF